MDELEKVYEEIFSQIRTLSGSVDTLCLLPISSGVFGGANVPHFHCLTWIAIFRVLATMDEGQLGRLTYLRTEFCLYDEHDFTTYGEAFDRMKTLLENGLATPCAAYPSTKTLKRRESRDAKKEGAIEVCGACNG